MKVKLGEYIQEYSVRNKANEDIPVYSVTNTQGFCQDYFGKEVASKDKSTYKIVPRGYFAYNPSRINVGSVDWQRDEDQVIVSPLYNVFSVSPELNQQYLYYYLKSDFALHRIKAVATGSVRDNLKLEMLKNFPIRIPRVEEQEYIVQVLDKAKNIINLRRNELQKLDDLIKARFIELFGDPLIEDDRYPRVPLGSLAEVGSSKRIFEKEYVSEGIPFYRTKEIVELSKGNRITTELFITKERYDEIRSEYGVPQKGDLLISAVGTIGVIWIVDGKNDFYFKDGNLLRVSATEKFVPEYLKHLLEALISAYKSEMSSGTAYAALTISALKEMMVYDVPHAEQEQFAAFVEQTDKSKLLSGCRLFHSWAPENRDKPKHVGVPQRKTKVLRGGRRQQ